MYNIVIYVLLKIPCFAYVKIWSVKQETSAYPECPDRSRELPVVGALLKIRTS